SCRAPWSTPGSSTAAWAARSASRPADYQLIPLRTSIGPPANGWTWARPRARSTQPFTALSPNDSTSETDCTLPEGANVMRARPWRGPESQDVAAAVARPTALAMAARSGPFVGAGGGG